MSHVHEALRRASQNPIEAQSPSLDLPQIISTLLKRKIIFLSVFSGLLLAGCTLVLIMPKKYEAEMKFLVKNERQDLVISPDKSTATVTSNQINETEINSEIELLRSNDVLRNVVLKSGLSHPEPGTVQAAGPMSPVSVDRALAGLRNALSIAAVKKSSIIDITYASKDPQLASRVLQNLRDSYLEVHLRSHGTPGSYNFFNQQAEDYRVRLARSEDDLKQFREKYSSLVQPNQDEALTERSTAAQASLEDTDTQIAEYQQRISRNQQILAGLDSRILTRVRTVPQAQLLGNLNQTIIELRNKRTELVTKFKPDDRMVQEVDKQIADTSAALESALTQVSNEKETDNNPIQQAAQKDLVAAQVALSGLEARRSALAAIVSNYKSRMVNLAGATIEHDQLLRQVKENEDNYLLYRKKSEEARIAESLDQERITNVAVVQSPVTPVRPVNKTLLYALLVAIFATMIASGAVVALERHWFGQFRSKEPLGGMAAAN